MCRRIVRCCPNFSSDNSAYDVYINSNGEAMLAKPFFTIAYNENGAEGGALPTNKVSSHDPGATVTVWQSGHGGLCLHRLEHCGGRQRHGLCSRRYLPDQGEHHTVCPVDARLPRHAAPQRRHRRHRPDNGELYRQHHHTRRRCNDPEWIQLRGLEQPTQRQGNELLRGRQCIHEGQPVQAGEQRRRHAVRAVDGERLRHQL